jgi:hypothetical protein
MEKVRWVCGRDARGRVRVFDCMHDVDCHYTSRLLLYFGLGHALDSGNGHVDE